MKTYTDALKEVLEFISNPDENWDPLGPIPTIQNWLEDKINASSDEDKEIKMIGRPLIDFNKGDILYSGETEDYFPCIFKYNGNSDGVITDNDFIVQQHGVWCHMWQDGTLYNEKGVFYRLATPEEIKLFNEEVK